MKKYFYIIIGIIITLALITFILYQSNKFPDNVIYDLGGYYEQNQIIDMYEYDENIYLITRNKEITNSVMLDDDYTLDEMLNIVVLDNDFSIREVIEVIETQTLENDGDNVRNQEFSLSTYQYNSQIYISLSLYGENHMIIVDTTSNNYSIHNMDMFLSSFIIRDDTIYGVGATYDYNEKVYTIKYYELGLSLNVLGENTIGDIDFIYQKPLINSEYIFIQGDIESNIFSWDTISKFNMNSEDIEIIDAKNIDGIMFQYINKDEIIYSIHTINNEEIYITFYNASGAQIQTSINEEFPILSLDKSRFVFMHYEMDYQNNVVRLLDQTYNEEILIEFDRRTYLLDIYYLNDSLYLVVDFAETDLDRLFYGHKETYILKYNIDDLDEFKK